MCWEKLIVINADAWIMLDYYFLVNGLFGIFGWVMHGYIYKVFEYWLGCW